MFHNGNRSILSIATMIPIFISFAFCFDEKFLQKASDTSAERRKVERRTKQMHLFFAECRRDVKNKNLQKSFKNKPF